MSVRDQVTLGVLAFLGIALLAATFAGTVSIPFEEPGDFDVLAAGDGESDPADGYGAPSARWKFALDPNTAELGELVILPGLGPKLGQKIVDYRRTNGPFRKAADLENVNGIGPKKRGKIEKFLSLPQ